MRPVRSVGQCMGSARCLLYSSIRTKYTSSLQGPLGFSKLEPLIKRDLESTEVLVNQTSSFDQLRIFPSVRHAMVEEIRDQYTLRSTYIKSKEELKINPTPAQSAAIRKIMKSRNGSNESNRLKVFNFVSDTGSGKTWAYLATILSKMKLDDMDLFSQSPARYKESRAMPIVRSVVFVPTVEMIEQVHGVITRANRYKMPDVQNKIKGEYRQFLEHEPGLNVRAFKWASGTSHKELYDYLKNGPIDVLVTTPYKLASLAQLQNVDRPYRPFAGTKYAVFDEADTLMHESFLQKTKVCMKNMPRLLDLILCGATITKAYAQALKSLVPGDIINVHLSSAHKLPRGLRIKLIHTYLPPYNGSKEKCLAQAIYAIHNEGSDPEYVKRIIVFVNSTDDVEPLASVLVSQYGHRPEDILPVSGKNTLEERKERVRPFLEPPQKVGSSKIKVLITTDLLGRGIDFNGVKNVIMYDLPRTSNDLMHRCGRTARMGQSGTVFVLVEKKMRNSWVKGLKNAVNKRYSVM